MLLKYLSRSNPAAPWYWWVPTSLVITVTSHQTSDFPGLHAAVNIWSWYRGVWRWIAGRAWWQALSPTPKCLFIVSLTTLALSKTYPKNPENGVSDVPDFNIRELQQTRTATATRGARKRVFPYFWRLCNSAYSYRGSNFLRFCQSFCCFIVSNYRRATVVVSQNDAPVLTTTQKWSNWSRTWGTTTPRSCQFHIFTCSFCLLQLV